MLFAGPSKVEDLVIVVNKYKVKSEYVDIMRGSPLGNPSSVQDRGRNKAISDFDAYLTAELKKHDSDVRKEMDRLLDRVCAGEIVRLGCCCKPKNCHGDVIRSRLIRAAKKRNRRGIK